jgi:glycosyltransferase involved in cell wall biosynthesis
MNFPLVSVIVNCHNGEKYLSKCIKSILNQTFKNFEIIFWDNSSKDKSKKIIYQFNDKRIKKYFSKKFHKLYAARNLAIKKSKGEYISFLDVDDIWKRNKLSEQVKVLKKNKNIKIIYTNYIFNNEIKKIKFLKYKNKLPAGYITQNLLNDYKIGILTALVQKKLFNNLRFNPSYNIIGDFDFFIRASIDNKIMSIQKPLAMYRSHENNMSGKKIDIYCEELKKWLHQALKNKKLKNYNFFNFKKYLVKLKIKNLLFKYLNIHLGV